MRRGAAEADESRAAPRGPEGTESRRRKIAGPGRALALQRQDPQVPSATPAAVGDAADPDPKPPCVPWICLCFF